jgi:diadenosine tetraphosphate (Ap4A) HIT family hydrolase
MKRNIQEQDTQKKPITKTPQKYQSNSFESSSDTRTHHSSRSTHNQSNNQSNKQSNNHSKCGRPCYSSLCYVCHPEKSGKLDHYMWSEDPSCKNIFINQNLGQYREIVIVPREHVGEFRLLNPQQATIFFKELIEVTKRLITDYKMNDVAYEISYGNWIVHGEFCPHYHAHCHVMSDNITEVLNTLKENGVLNCKINNRDKVIDQTDVTTKLPFKPNLLTNKWEKFPLFQCVYDWFGSIPGYVLRIELTKETSTENPDDINFSFAYYIRTSASHSKQLQDLVKSPPKGLKL